MSDGFGTAFESELVLDENQGGSTWWTSYPNHTTEEIEGILEDFMGVHTLIKMPTLPYDGIHHIDMHMKLLDEETLLVSQYPSELRTAHKLKLTSNMSCRITQRSGVLHLMFIGSPLPHNKAEDIPTQADITAPTRTLCSSTKHFSFPHTTNSTTPLRYVFTRNFSPATPSFLSTATTAQKPSSLLREPYTVSHTK